MTRILQPDPAGIEAAAALLHCGELVAFGTETVYGLGGDATQGRAVAAIFAAKGRPRFNPLICHYATAAGAFAHVLTPGIAERLAETFWPGPLTLVLPRGATCPVDLLAASGLDTLAVRVPAHPMARALIAALGRPIAAPSANRSGGVSPTTSTHVLADLDGRIAAILDGGPCAIGLESTVLDLSASPPFLLRAGGIPLDAIEAVIGKIGRPLPANLSPAAPRSPGQLASHYAPRLPLRLDAAAPAPNEALLAFGPAPQPAALIWNLSATGDLQEAAARLFSGLRWLDTEAPARGLTSIAAMPIPPHGLGDAINDRLQRAAAPRS